MQVKKEVKKEGNRLVRTAIYSTRQLCELLLSWLEETIALWVGVGRRILFAESAYEQSPLPLEEGEIAWREVFDKKRLVVRAMMQSPPDGQDLSRWWPWPSVRGPLPGSFPALPMEEELPFSPEELETAYKAWVAIVVLEISRSAADVARDHGMDYLAEGVAEIAEEVFLRLNEMKGWV